MRREHRIVIFLILICFIGKAKTLSSAGIMINSNCDTLEFVIKSLNNIRLDTFNTIWNLTKEQVIDYFDKARIINEKEAGRLIAENYHPFVIEGECIRNDSCFDYLITPSGIGILVTKTEQRKYLFYKYRSIANDPVVLPSKCYSGSWDLKILSKNKFIKKNQANEDFYQWCNHWYLTVNQINDYIRLCKKEKESVLYQIFMNLPCYFQGYVVLNNEIYRYRLECSGMTWFRKLSNEIHNIQEEEYGWGCYDSRGLKYVFTIDNNLESDNLE